MVQVEADYFGKARGRGLLKNLVLWAVAGAKTRVIYLLQG
jgi:hypothetical protein